MSAPRMMPRTVSSLMFSPARSDSSRAILFPFEVIALSGGRRGRMAADCAPAALVKHPDVGQQHAILDHAPEIFDPPFRMDSPNHDLVERRRIAHIELDRVDLAPLDRVEPIVAVHH